MQDELRDECEACEGTGGVVALGIVLVPCECCFGTGDHYDDGLLDHWSIWGWK